MKAVQRWQSLKAATTAPPSQANLQNTAKKSKKISYSELESWRLDLVFTHCYPRLDANVSKAQNHLLKSPFCVHPKTGRVCVPMDPKTAEDFDPFSVPTVRMLCQEIDVYDKTHPESAESVADFEKTSMKQAMKTFDKTFMNDLRSVIRYVCIYILIYIML